MATLKPRILLVLDIETTGLCPERNYIVQICAKTLAGDTFNVMVRKPAHGGEEHPEAISLHERSGLWGAYSLANHGGGARSPRDAQALWSAFLDRVSDHGAKRIVPCGKNAAGFDIPFLKASGFDCQPFAHRVLDIGSVCTPVGHWADIPDLKSCCERLGVNLDPLKAHWAEYDVDLCIAVLRALEALHAPAYAVGSVRG